MRINNISNINFRAIRITNSNYAVEPKDSKNISYDGESAYQSMSDAFQIIEAAADTLDITTQREQRIAIHQDYRARISKEQARIYKGKTTDLPSPIRAVRSHLAERRLDKERQQALKWVGPSDCIDTKDTTVSVLEDSLSSGIQKVKELDMQIQANILRAQATSKSNASVWEKTMVREGFSKVAGYEEEKEVLAEAFIRRVWLEQNGEDIDVPGSVLFFGPYNNGKTYITKNVAQEAGCKIIRIRTGTSELLMPKLIKKAEAAQEHFEKTGQRTIIFLDELDRVITAEKKETKKFEEFIKTCSKKYHCSVFVATNIPSKLGLDLDDPDVFPIRMSIDMANDENLKAVVKYYLDDMIVGDIDYDLVVQELRNQEQVVQKRYTNAQFGFFPEKLSERFASRTVTQEQLLEFIREDKYFGTPVLDNESIKHFEDEYKKIME